VHSSTPATHALAESLAQYSIDRLAEPVPLDRSATAAALRSAAGATITTAGLGPDEALRLWSEVLAPACLSSDHSRYLAFIPNAPTKAASSFDMVVGASSVYGGSWLEGAGAVFAENAALRWVADLAGLPSQAGGVFVPGGTDGNLSALVAARAAAAAARGGRPARWSVCVTTEVHSSVKHALRVVMDVDTVAVAVDGRGRMTGPALRAAVDALPAAERDQIFAVVVTAGSTNIGAVDDIAGCGAVARENGWWLHVDGAYGGAALCAPSARALFDGIEHADSFIVDPHKWLFAPYDCCALLYRDPELGRVAHTQHADYLDAVTIPGEWNPSDFAIGLSRRARGLPFWFSLAVHGTAAYTAAVEQTLSVARSGADLIRSAAHLRLLAEPDLSVLLFERIGWQIADYERWNGWLVEQQIGFVTPSHHGGRPCSRFAIVNPQTTVDDLALLIDSMR